MIRFALFVSLFLLSGNVLFGQTLIETTAVMGAAEEVGGGGKKSPPIANKGPIGNLNQANAERNAAIEAGAVPAGAENNQAAPEGGAPAGQAPAAAPGGRDILQTGWWGPGGYVSPTKLSLYLLVFLIWTFCASWMNGDMEKQNNPNRETINLIYVGLYALVGLGLFFVPIFWAVFPVTVLSCFVPPIVYVVQRNAKVPPHEKVLTPEHLFFVYATFMNRYCGGKIKVKPRLAYQVGPPIEFDSVGKNIAPQILQGRLIMARNAPGYNEFRQHVYDAITSRATNLMFDFTPERTVIRHQVDGVWLDLPPLPRTIERGKTKDVMEEMLEAVKILVGANPNDRRSKQAGNFLAAIRKVKYDCEFVSQGTKTGEAAMVQFIAKKVPFKSLDALGMRPETQAKLIENLNAKKGIFIIAAPPANGLRSSMDVFSRHCDRFTRDLINIEDAVAPSEEIENVVLVRYDSSKGENVMTVLPDVLFKEPHALIIRDMTQLDVLERCCEEVDNDRIFITMIRAKDSVEAILRYLAIKIPPPLFISHLNGVITQRLIRKLCPECKEPYQPAPQLLQQLGLRPDQAKEFYRTRTPLPEHEERKRGICSKCNGIGYFGRTALFELLTVNDDIREVILANPANPAAIRQAFVKQNQTGFLYEGIPLLLKGETTVEEFSRVLKM